MLVRSSDLRSVIQEFIRDHEREHPHTSSAPKSNTPVVSGRDYLCVRSGISIRKMHDVMNADLESIDVDVADKILCAMDRTDLFHTRVPIYEEDVLG